MSDSRSRPSNPGSESADARSDDTRGDRGGVDEGAPLPPGPAGLPVAGNVLQIVSDPLGYVDRLRSYGDVVHYQIFGRKFTALLHPDHVERVLVGEPERFEQYAFEELNVDFAPEGLLMSEGEQWRRQRELIQPAFSPARIAAFADAIVDRTATAADGWADGQTVAVDRAFSELTLEILTTTLFDLELAERRETVADAASAINDLSDGRSVSAFLPGWIPTPRNVRCKRRLRRFDALVADLIAERRADTGGADDLLSTLLEAADEAEPDQGLSDEELRDQLVTFLFAGHETTSLALTYACWSLAHNPDVRERLEAELEDICGDREPTMADVSDLTDTEQVIEETLRLYPPAFMIVRKTREDVVFDGYRVPEGTSITLPQYALHRDERFWDRPDEFRPDRFAEGNGGDDRPAYAYFPFGGGPRHCVGMRFAMLELKLVLATLLRRVRFDAAGDADLELRPTTTLSPDDDITLTVRRRH
ncbi:cytochrome P450 [Salinadaptatus halalkaliphilus]|uniref:Cytochrome P450 n=1 Tax=Salinadaptatus halalkaliphilus TaxID=2419781 RepID=A0A4S3TSS3_9EURY|nr:cytochrome P450 [Salinadaptatus halalkaliphilus]THE66780.1 cytochrome P450 [Salinadaptatus halalkaliphilus]